MPIDIFGSGPWEERGGEVVRRLIRDLVLTPEQAAGLAGNLGYESEGFKTLQERKPMVAGSAGGWGIAQWTGPRRRAFLDWIGDRKLDASSDAANYGFLVAELKDSEAAFLSRLCNTASLYEATRLTHVAYERPADQSEAATAKRFEWAKRALAGAQSMPLDKQSVDHQPADEPTDVDPDIYKNAVKVVQGLLRMSGDLDSAIDGMWGPDSERAALAFQRRARK